MTRLLMIAGVAVALAGCASSYENRVASRLHGLGLSRPMSQCMAERMVDRLSVVQLRKLSMLGKDYRGDVRDMSVGEVLDRFQALGDPEILDVVTRSSIGCAIAA